MDHTKGSKRRPPAPTPAPAPASAAAPKNAAPAEAEPAEDAQEWVNRRASAQATRAAHARQVSGRRRFVDPTTCEREYTVAEIEFMHAMHEYKHTSGRMFPTWSEVLEVIKALGYAKESLATTAGEPAAARGKAARH